MIDEPIWYLTKDGDVSCLALYERHYSRYAYADGRRRHRPNLSPALHNIDALGAFDALCAVASRAIYQLLFVHDADFCRAAEIVICDWCHRYRLRTIVPASSLTLGAFDLHLSSPFLKCVKVGE